MFDLRYHVASLAAVFLALIIGIVVGVGISSGGFVKKGERKLLTDQIADLRNRLSAAFTRMDPITRPQPFHAYRVVLLIISKGNNELRDPGSKSFSGGADAAVMNNRGAQRKKFLKGRIGAVMHERRQCLG